MLDRAWSRRHTNPVGQCRAELCGLKKAEPGTRDPSEQRGSDLDPPTIGDTMSHNDTVTDDLADAAEKTKDNVEDAAESAADKTKSAARSVADAAERGWD